MTTGPAAGQQHQYSKHDKHKRPMPVYMYVIFLVIVALCVFVGLRPGSSSTDEIGYPQPETESPQHIRKQTTATSPAAVVPVSPDVKKKKIAYAITVTKDGHFLDGALVLGYSALKVEAPSYSAANDLCMHITIGS